MIHLKANIDHSDKCSISSTQDFSFYLRFLEAVLLSAIATLVLGAPPLFSASSPFNYSEAALILTIHFIVLTFPILYAFVIYHRTKDLFFPSFVAAITFALFHVMNNPSVLSTPFLLASRDLRMDGGQLASIVIKSYFLLFVAWSSYLAGYFTLHNRSYTWSVRGMAPNVSTPLYFSVGLVFVSIGIIGNAIPLGGLDAYFAKMAHFYTRDKEYIQFIQWGGTKYVIAQKFLPVGLVMLAYGYGIRKKLNKRKLLIALCLISLANIFLSCASGGRGAMLLVAFYAIILYNYKYTRLTIRSLLLILLIIFSLAFFLGILRAQIFFGGDLSSAVEVLKNNMGMQLKRFSGFYLTNYLGTITLVNEVQKSGIDWGYTAFAGLTGLFGGPAPITTQAEIWYRFTGSYEGANPRYGPPGELYFNFGWFGVIIGMFCIGMFVSFLSKVYRKSKQQKTLANGLIAIFVVMTARFIIIANLSYIPPYFTYLATPFYLIFILFRKVKC